MGASRSTATTPAGRRRASQRTARSRSRASATRPKSARSQRSGTARATTRRSGRAQAARSRRKSARRTPKAKRFRRRVSLPRAGRLPHRIAVLALVAVALGAAYTFYLRDSSLVAVTEVEVAGVRSGEPQQIVAELEDAALGMSTLHVDHDRLERVAARFPTIESVEADANFPHGMRIEVAERPPVLIARAGGRVVAVADDGTLLAGITLPADADLPAIELDALPSGDRLEGVALEQALAVGAAPGPLQPLVEGVRQSEAFGVELVLRGGIPVRFGSGARAAEKWAAAAAVLADPKLEGLSYIDVRVPERAAAGDAVSTATPPDPPA